MMKNDSPKKILIDLIERLIRERKLFPQRFLITDDRNNLIYSSSDKKVEKYRLTFSRFSVLKSSRSFFNRGKLLDDILLIEYLLSQIAFLRLSKGEVIFFDYDKVKKWNDFLDDFDFNRKTKLVHSWGLIDKEEKKVIDKIRRFRNQLAHSFSDSYFEYDDKPLKESFPDFEKDFYSVFTTLIGVNERLWEEQDLIRSTIEYMEAQFKEIDSSRLSSRITDRRMLVDARSKE